MRLFAERLIAFNNMSNIKNKITKGEIVKWILTGIGLTGLAVVAMAAPNIFQAFPRSYRRDRDYSRKSLDQAVRRSLKRGLIKFTSGSKGWRIELTETGQREFRLFEMKEKMIKQPKKWNGTWHLLIFDIEEKRKVTRELVRRALERIGFYRLQDSVWVHPYECEEVLELLRTKYKVRHDALYICAKKIAKDEWLRKHFGLNS